MTVTDIATTLLVKHGADVNAKDKTGSTPLLVLRCISLGISLANEDWKQSAIWSTLTCLLGAGADINAQESIEGKGLLHFMARNWNAVAIDTLVKEYHANIHLW